MPTVTFDGSEVECEEGAVLRDVLVESGNSPHTGRSRHLNCRGMATCGTCAVEVEGKASDRTAGEERRLSFPPHDPDSGLRLACQVRVEGDLVVRKYPGFWGQHTDREPR